METKVEYTADEMPVALPEEAYAPEAEERVSASGANDPEHKSLETRLREAARVAHTTRTHVIEAKARLVKTRQLRRAREHELEWVTAITTAQVYEMPEVAGGKNAEIRKAIADRYLVTDAHISAKRNALESAMDQEDAGRLALDLLQAELEESQRAYEAIKLDALYAIHVAARAEADDSADADWFEGTQFAGDYGVTPAGDYELSATGFEGSKDSMGY